MPGNLPDFLVIGAAKCGTTSLFYYLTQHPNVYLPEIKELNYFSYHPGRSGRLVGPGVGPGDLRATVWTRELETYKNYFKPRKLQSVKGEASVSYIYSPIAAESIFNCIPHVKLIVMLRNPIERAWSSYLHMKRDGRETLGFEEALASEENRIRKGWEFSWHYRSLGFYAQQLERYYSIFPRNQIHVILLDHFARQPSTCTAQAFEFLGLPDIQNLDTNTIHNQSGIPRSSLLSKTINRPSAIRNLVKRLVPSSFGHTVMEKLRKVNIDTVRPQLLPSTRKLLFGEYASDIERLEKMINRDLSSWLRDDDV